MKHKAFWIVAGSAAVVGTLAIVGVKKGWFKKSSSASPAAPSIPDAQITELIASAKLADSTVFRAMDIAQARAKISATATADDVNELINALNRLTQYGSDENNAPPDVVEDIDAALTKLTA